MLDRRNREGLDFGVGGRNIISGAGLTTVVATTLEESILLEHGMALSLASLNVTAKPERQNKELGSTLRNAHGHVNQARSHR